MPKIVNFPDVSRTVLLDLKSASAFIGVSPDTLRRAYWSGALAALKPGQGTKAGKLFFKRETLLNWLNSLERKAV